MNKLRHCHPLYSSFLDYRCHRIVYSFTRARKLKGRYNNAIVDHNSPALCTPITPRQRRNGPFCCCVTLFAASALQCIVNARKKPKIAPPLEISPPCRRRTKQHAQKNWQRSRVWLRRYPVGQTDTQTLLITILRHCWRGGSNQDAFNDDSGSLLTEFTAWLARSVYGHLDRSLIGGHLRRTRR